MDVMLLVVLALLGLVAGVGITAVGPGGVLVTAGLFLLTGLPPAVVAGTALVTQVATGTVGSLAFARSGQLHEPQTRRIALLLALTALLGTPVGVLLNGMLPAAVFGPLLAGFVVLVAVLVWRRHRSAAEGGAHEHPRHSTALLVAGGLVVAAASGLFGVGGPLLAVPLLVAVGTPMLPALAAAQLQSIVIAGVGSLGYLAQGSVDWMLALVVGVPQLLGVLIGWWVARRVPARTLRVTMIALLLLIAPFLALRG